MNANALLSNNGNSLQLSGYFQSPHQSWQGLSNSVAFDEAGIKAKLLNLN